MSLRTRLAMALLATSALLLALPAGAQEDAHIREMEVYLHEYSAGLHILPDQIQAEVGETLRLVVVNTGQSPHNLIVCGDPGSAKDPGTDCEKRWGFTPMIPSQERATLLIPLTEAGTFSYYCDIPGHKVGGMGGTLQVKGDVKKESPSGALVGTLMAFAGVALLISRR